jgi:Tat protein translocase TatB subunit
LLIICGLSIARPRFGVKKEYTMNFFGMGTWEIMIILIAALVIFGPDRLPEMAGKIGKSIRDLRQMTSDLTGEFERSAGVQELKNAVQGELTGVKSQVNSVTDSVKRDLDKAGSKVSSTASPATTAASNTTSASSKVAAAKPAAASTDSKAATTVVEAPKASKKDPLSDVSFFDELATQPGSAAKPVTAMAKPAATKATSPTAQPNGSNGLTAPEHLDALSRARQRRVAAGYNRRPT